MRIIKRKTGKDMIPFSFCKNSLKNSREIQDSHKNTNMSVYEFEKTIVQKFGRKYGIYNKYISFTEFFPCFFPYYTS